LISKTVAKLNKTKSLASDSHYLFKALHLSLQQ
jgi:hypothetical protein